MSGLEQSYYRGALTLLRYAEHRAQSRRRFGTEADATWRQFKGELGTSDRVHLLIADAHAQWPGSVGASQICSLPGVCEDDAFGADWSRIDGIEAEALWRDVTNAKAPDTLSEALTSIAAAWGLSLKTTTLPKIAPSSKLVVAGPSAVASLIEHFASNGDLDWARQVTCIATPPAHRQIAASAGVLLNLTSAISLVASDAAARKVAGALKVISPDAAPEDAALAGKLAG